MKNLKVHLFILTVAIFLIGCEKDDTSPSPAAPSSQETPEYPSKKLLVSLVNDYRTTGCNCGTEYFGPVNPVVWNDTLELAAKAHSIDMNENNFFEHTGSDGSSAGDRLDRVKYPWRTWGENIARGYDSEKDVVEAWINSVGHCKNIMNGNFEEMGVAISDSYWTQVFGTQ